MTKVIVTGGMGLPSTTVREVTIITKLKIYKYVLR